MMQRGLLALCLLGGAALLAGFVLFVRALPMGAVAPRRADGIVVLTGGADRVATGLRLLTAGRGRILLISGVGGTAPFASLARRAGADPLLASRVTLGRAAASTYGNAQETAAWARAQKLGSLLVVTAYYHMPRALSELSRALPDVALYPVPVQPGALGGGAPWRLIAAEYAKFLASEVGLSAIAAHPMPAWAGREQQSDRGTETVRSGG